MNSLRSLFLLAIIASLPSISNAANILRMRAPVVEAPAANPTPPVSETPEEPQAPTIYSSCLEIKQSKPSSASGLYNLAINGSEMSVYCDMVSGGGGWTMVAAQFEGDFLSNWNEGMQSDYDPSLNTKRSFTLKTSQIPAHSQTAFGKDLDATFVDFIDHQYSTGEIPKTLVTGAKAQYHIHRSNTIHHSGHDPESTTGSDYGAGNEWSNTLTLDKTGGVLYTWAFSARNTITVKRGFSMNGVGYAATIENFAWTVWVR